MNFWEFFFWVSIVPLTVIVIVYFLGLAQGT